MVQIRDRIFPYYPILLAAGLFLGLLAISQANYLLFHTLAEMFSIVIAVTIFVLTWNTRDYLNNGFLELLGVGFLFVALLDLIHTLSFVGMGVFPDAGANLPTQLWVAARFIHGGSFLAAAFFIGRRVHRIPVVIVYTVVTGLLLLSIFTWQNFPVALVETASGVALTPFKIGAELVVILLFLVSMVLIYRSWQAFDRRVLAFLLLSGMFTIATEALFTGYLRVTDIWNMGGHFFKIVAFYLIYKAIIETGFFRPYTLLFRDLKQSEEQLRASSQRERARAAQLEAIMDAVPAVVWIAHDPEAKFVTGNRTAHEFLRVKPADGQTISDPSNEVPLNFRILRDGRELPDGELPLQKAGATGQPVRDFEGTVEFTDGVLRRLYGNVTPLLDDSGRPSGSVGAFLDITERVRTEQALLESEQRYRSLFESMTEGFALNKIIRDEQGNAVDYRILEVNPAFESMTGLSREKVVGKRIRELVPDVNPVWIERYANAVSTGESIRFEDYSTLLDRYFEVLVFSMGDDTVATFSIDVTQRHRDQEALRQSEGRLRRLVDANIIGIVYSDAQGRVNVANDLFLEMIGYTREEFEAGLVNWVAITPSEYLAADSKGIAEANLRGACTPYEKEYVRKDGSRVPVLIGYAYFGETASPYISFVLDLTARKQAEARLETYAMQLERSNRELEDFAFTASHDLQEPLRKIQAFGDRLSQQLGERLDAEERDYFERMMSASNRMRNMIEDLLELSRVTTRGRPFEQVDLAETIREVISDLEVRIERAGGRVEVNGLPKVEADPLQMHQLLQNLVANALKFHKPEMPPHVRVSGRPVDGGSQVEIMVEDNGVGFDQQYAEKIFQPFQRLHGMGQYEGSGIGLTICRKIVERHSGVIAARSTPGEGSTFVVTLPVKQFE